MALMKKLRKHQKIIFYFLTGLIAISFGVTYEMTMIATREKEENVCGSFYVTDLKGKEELISITFDEFANFKYRWEKSNRPVGIMVPTYILSSAHYHKAMRIYFRPYFNFADDEEETTEEQENNIIWELIIAKYTAEKWGLGVTDSEIETKIKEYLMRGTQGANFKEVYLNHLSGLGISDEIFRLTVKEALLIKKFFDVASGNFVLNYGDFFDEFLDRFKEVKVRYAFFNSDKYIKEVVLPGNKQRSEKDKITDVDYKTARTVSYLDLLQELKKIPEPPERYKYEYAFISQEEIRKNITDPTEEELKEYYEKNKKEKYKLPELPDSNKDANEKATTTDSKNIDEKKQPKYRPFEEVKEEIRNTLKEQRYHSKISEMENNVEKEVERIINKTSKLPDFKKLVEKFKLGEVKETILCDERILRNYVNDEWGDFKLSSISSPTAHTPQRNLVDELREPKSFRKYLAAFETYKGFLTIRLIKPTKNSSGGVGNSLPIYGFDYYLNKLKESKSKDIARYYANKFKEKLRQKIDEELKNNNVTDIKNPQSPEQKDLIKTILNYNFNLVAEEFKVVPEESKFYSINTIVEVFDEYVFGQEAVLKLKLGEIGVVQGQRMPNKFAVILFMESRPPSSDDYNQDAKGNLMQTEFENKRSAYLESWFTGYVKDYARLEKKTEKGEKE